MSKIRKLIKDYKKNISGSEVALILFLTLLIITVFNPYRLDYYSKLVILPVCIFALVIQSYIKRWEFWLVISAALTFNLFFNYLFTANHLFIATYFSWSVMLIHIKGYDLFPSLKECAKWLLIIVIGTATLHKLTSVNFINGSFIAFEQLTGTRNFFITDLIWPNLTSFIDINRQVLYEIFNDSSLSATSRAINYPGSRFPVFVKIFTWIIAGYEALLLGLLLLYPRYKKILHLSLILFVWFTYTYTNENSFFSILCILGFLMTNEDEKKIRSLYTISVIVLLSMAATGYRPAIIAY